MEQWSLLEALRGVELALKFLGEIKGEPLQPVERPEDRMDGCGALVARVLEEEEEAFRDPRGVWERWCNESHECAHLASVLWRQWGAGAEQRGELEKARAWYVCGGEGVEDPLLREGWCAEHLGAGIRAAEMHHWASARTHWWVLRQMKADKAWMARLARRYCRSLEGAEGAALARGGQRADTVVWEEVCKATQIDDQTWDLLSFAARTGARVALQHHRLGRLQAFEEVSADLLRVLEALECMEVPEGQSAEVMEAIAEGWICTAAMSRDPVVALERLSSARRWYPQHPNAHNLLGTAAAAAAARALGRGWLVRARRYYAMAAELLPENEEMNRLGAAMEQSREDLR